MANLSKDALENVRKWASGQDPQNDPLNLALQTRVGVRFALLAILDILERLDAIEAKVSAKKNP